MSGFNTEKEYSALRSCFLLSPTDECINFQLNMVLTMVALAVLSVIQTSLPLKHISNLQGGWSHLSFM